MKLSKHQKKIVDAIINGDVYDIPSYLKKFNKWSLCKYDLTPPLAKFSEEDGGEQYKIIIDEDKAYVKGTSVMNMGLLGTTTVENKLLKNPKDIPDDAWEYQKAEIKYDIQPTEIEFKGKTFSFDFMKQGVNVAGNFNDIIEFMTLWAYLRQESLILEVPRDLIPDDIGILFELKHIERKPKNPFMIRRDKAPDSPLKPIEQIMLNMSEFYPSVPTFKLSSYMDEVWELNNEHLKNCEEYIGRKILSTGRLRVFARQLYTTTEKWQFLIPLIVSIIALIVSLLPLVLSLVSSEEPNQLTQISQQIGAIESIVGSNTTDQDVLDKLEKIKETLDEISTSVDEMNSNDQSEIVDNLTTLIGQLNELLAE